MVIEKGYAKINLGLEVLRKREDGYHDLDMIMTNLNLYDELYFEDHPGKSIIIECEELEHLRPEENLIYKAIDNLRSRYGIDRGVKVRVVKDSGKGRARRRERGLRSRSAGDEQALGSQSFA